MRFLLIAAAAATLSGAAYAQQAPERNYQAYSDQGGYYAQPQDRNWGWGRHRQSSAPSWGLHGGSNPMGSDANGS